LDEVAAFGNVLCCLHLVAREHPNLNVYIKKSSTCSNEITDGFRNALLKTIQDGCGSNEVNILLQLRDKLIVGLLFIYWM
jgi:hypothetical protein